MPNLVASFRRLPRDVQLFAWGSFLIGIGGPGILAVLFNLYLQRLGMGTEAIGLLLGVGPFIGAIGSIPAAMIGARMGNRQAMNLGVLIQIIAFVLLGRYMEDIIKKRSSAAVRKLMDLRPPTARVVRDGRDCRHGRPTTHRPRRRAQPRGRRGVRRA